MRDLHEQFRHLAGDVDGLSRLSAEQVRGRAERRRAGRRLPGSAAVAVAVAVVGFAAAFALARAIGDDREVLQPTAPAATDPAPTTGPPMDAAWLPAPWALASSRVYTWPAGEASDYRFCGQSMESSTRVEVIEQVLTHPSGQQAHLVRFTPELDEAFQIFKFSYASCLVPARAESIAGPRNVWAYDAVAGAAEVVGRAMHLAEVRGASEQQPATRAEAEAVLDRWTS